MTQVIHALQRYSQEMGPHFPLNCGNLLVSAQYMLPLQVIQKYLSVEQQLLDWGCGEGHFSYLLKQEGFDVHSYAYAKNGECDLVKNKINTQLQKKWNLQYSECIDPVALPHASNSYDAVLSLGVLEHVRETGGTELGSLQEIYRVLKPGGYFFCFHFPNKFSWIEALSRGINRLGVSKYYHRHRYTTTDIQKLVDATSFSLLETKKYNVFPRRMLCKIPPRFAQSRRIFQAIQSLERVCFQFFGTFAQNHFFVLQK